MPTLYEIGGNLTALHDLLIECDGEITDAEAEAAIDGWLAEMQTALETKVDNYCALIREYESRADARELEAKRLMVGAGAYNNNAKRLKGRLKGFLELHGIARLETERFLLSVQRNGGKAPLVVPERWEQEPASAPEAWQRRVIQLDKEAIREALEAGEQVDGCEIAPRGNHLRIR